MTLHSLPVAVDVGASSGSAGDPRIIGRSDYHRKAMRELAAAASTDVEVLLLGPSGVGKELYARWIHAHSVRAGNNFVAINCGAVPLALFENELFGHAGGAYTGAKVSSEGLVGEAEGGTLFLDEIDALEVPAQVKLLRFLQEREYRRLGESRIRKSNVRIITASNADLLCLVRQQRFREDLMYRVRVFPLRIPPLCERSEDIRPLLDEFVRRCASGFQVSPIYFAPEAMRHLESYSWPGNIRELENCVRYLTSLRLKRAVEPADLRLLDGVGVPRPARRATDNPPTEAGSPPPSSAPVSLREAKRKLVTHFERDFVIGAIRTSRGNIAHAARAAGKTRRAFFELMRKYSVQADDYR